MSRMKTGILMSVATTISFLCTYLLNLTMDNAEQYLAIVATVALDGIFGIIDIDYIYYDVSELRRPGILLYR